MNKVSIRNELVLPKLKQDEELIGYFQAQYAPSYWWLILIGPLWALGIRLYVIAVTNQGLHLTKFNLLGRPDVYNFFPSAEITSLHLGDGVMQAPLQLNFANGRELRLRVQLGGIGRIAKLDDTTREFLISHSG